MDIELDKQMCIKVTSKYKVNYTSLNSIDL